MKRNAYIAPAVEILQAEPQYMVAMSFNTDNTEWNDNVELEVKEDKDWNNIW